MQGLDPLLTINFRVYHIGLQEPNLTLLNWKTYKRVLHTKKQRLSCILLIFYLAEMSNRREEEWHWDRLGGGWRSWARVRRRGTGGVRMGSARLPRCVLGRSVWSRRVVAGAPSGVSSRLRCTTGANGGAARRRAWASEQRGKVRCGCIL